MAYVSTMILRSLRLLGEKERGGTLTTAEQDDCLNSFNSMLDGWSIERLMCYQITQESFPLSTGVVTYTIGPGATFATTRPTKIVDPCFVRDASNLDSALKIIDETAYGRIVMKGAGNTYPQYLMYDHGFSATSTASIKIYPAPIGSLTLFINSWKQLGSVSSVSQNLSLPPGYERAIVYNYAVEEAGGYVNIAPEVAMIAKQSKAAIKSLNVPDTMMRLEPGVVPIYTSNIITGP